MNILLVEDEKILSAALKEILIMKEFTVTQAYDGIEALEKMQDQKFDLIILDVMMPRMNGIEVTKKLRASGDRTPIIMLTAKAEIDDKVEGLETGADDYLAKPFKFKELLARMNAVLRRSSSEPSTNTYGDLILNLSVYQVSCGKNSVYLTKKEFLLLDYLIRHKNVVSSSEQLLADLWDDEADVDTTIVWAFLSNLRKKLKDINSKVNIKSFRGKGYQVEYVS